MPSLTHLRTILCLPLAGVVMVALASPSSSEQQASASFQVTPDDHYIGGQALTFSGNIGAAGQRTVRLQSHMGRPGDTWVPLEGISSTTQSDGSFDFVFRAPGMKGISYRVVSGGLTTNAIRFEALQQDLVLAPRTTPVAGAPFVIEVDTTPELARRPDVQGLQPIPGRTLTLQRRIDGDEWEQMGQSSVNAQGNGSFTVTETDPGTVVYRVRQEDWTADGNQIGWFPSFPTYVEVTQDGQAPADSTDRIARETCVGFPTGDQAGPTASGTNLWGPSLFDFAWVAGESLTSKPYRGTRKRGQWVDYTDGSGRVNKNNGGLMLDSKRDNVCGDGDFGTTRATLQGNAQTYGRWETRLRLKSDENNDRDYLTVVELVPERAADYACGARNITLAAMTPHGNSFSFGAKAGKTQWKGTKSGVSINNTPQNFAVEVTQKHVTWFFQGKPVGTVKSRAASSDVPMTLRLSMEGGPDEQEMNHTELISDWQRSWTLKRGAKVTNGKSLTKSSFSAPNC